MPTPDEPVPLYIQLGLLWRWPVDRYERMVREGFPEDIDRIELLEGILVYKPDRTAVVEAVRGRLRDRLSDTRPGGWQVQMDWAATLADSVPEADAALVRHSGGEDQTRDLKPADTGLVVEVSDSSLVIDRTDKGRIYARSNLPVYWVVNLVDRQVEVYTGPRPADPVPASAARTDYRPGDAVPLVLDGRTVAQLPVDQLLG